MEFGLKTVRSCRPTKTQQRRHTRANWWFQRMREVVEHSADWAPAQGKK
jgi:hypothetical protein